MGHIQSLFNENYEPPISLNEFDRIWFSALECPETQVYVNHAPDMHETKLNSLLMTWAGMLPMGNPTIISCNHLQEETGNPAGDIPLGIVVFVSPLLTWLSCTLKL